MSAVWLLVACGAGDTLSGAEGSGGDTGGTGAPVTQDAGAENRGGSNNNPNGGAGATGTQSGGHSSGGDGSGGDGSGGDGSGGDGSGGTTGGTGGTTGGTGGTTGGTGGTTGGTGGTGGDTGCLPSEVETEEGACVLPGLIDDFGSCDRAIYEVEGRVGGWYFYRGDDVGCEPGRCEGASVPPWASTCGAWTSGGYDPDYLPTYPDLYAGIGVSLNSSGMFYNVCDYTHVEVEYASEYSVDFYAKWDDVGEDGERDSVRLPGTSGVVTASVPLSNFSGLDCTTLTEFQFEPATLTGFGIAVYSLRLTNSGSPQCSDGATRCTSSGGLEECVGGTWTASSCASGMECVGDRCVDAGATPVERHGHLSVSGTQMVDEYGYPVQLKGISSQWLNYEYDGYATNASAMAWMRDNWGITVFRAAMGADEDHPGSYMDGATARADMLNQVETIIQNAIDVGIYVLVDWHSHTTYTTEASEFFAYIAAEYGSEPNVLIETYNEPLNVSWTGTLRPYHQAVVAAFRDADPNNSTHPNIAILGTPNWDQDVDVAAQNPLSGVNLMYTAHFYACSHGTTYLNKAKAALNAGLPIFVTEWGATDANGGAYPDTQVCSAAADDWHDWMDANGIGWAAWKLDDCDGQTYPDASCLLANDAPITGGWTSYLNGHASYVVSKL